MLSAKYRFHSRGGVNFTYKHGRRINTPLVTLIYAPNSRKKTRCAVVVSKKVMKTAIGRNRIRRRVYEAIRLELSAYRSPVDRIFLVHSKELLTLPFSDLQTLIESLLFKSNKV